MISIKERGWAKTMVAGQDEQKVLNFIAAEKLVTLERIVEQFPWIRWSDLFLILGRFRREGLVTVHQVGSCLEMRIKDHSVAVV